MKEVKIVTPVGMLGYGIPKADFARAIESGAQAVIIDSGSTDPGPYQLGLGAMLAAPEAYERDLRVILEGIGTRKIPLLIGSAGGPGTAKQVDDLIAILGSVAVDLGKSLKVAAVYSDVDAGLVHHALASGRIAPCASAPALTPADIDASAHIVAQMGAEPILKVLREQPDVDVVICGRAYDPSPFAAFCMYHGIEAPGIYWHMGKIMECGGLCAEPKGKVILATVRTDSFDLTPMSPHERCTPLSVAAHTLYEKTRPDLLAGPGGVLDLTGSRYVQIDTQTTRVSGSEFRPSAGYQVKLEGAAVCGYRTIFIGGVRDPVLTEQIDAFLGRVRDHITDVYPALRYGDAQLHFHVYGKHGVMGTQEPLRDAMPHEVGILCEVTASTQELANAICSNTRISVLHMPYPGQMATAGNLALPLNPPENPIGPVCRFSIYHLMTVDSPESLFPYRMLEV